ncbi:MAG: MgtC/SapB family protein [Desulfuromonadales bacterium]
MFLDSLLGSYHLMVLVKLFLAGLAGGVIGLERETHGRPAGLRTHLLVAVGAALMTIVSEGFYLKYGGMDALGTVRLDPARVAAQVVVGIGFLGAGVIIKEGFSIRGLTTAASLWLCAGVGMAFGAGFFGPAVMAAIIALASLVFLKRLEQILNKDRYLHLTVVATLAPDIYPDMERIFQQHRLRISDLRAATDFSTGEVEYQIVLTRQKRRIGREMTTLIAQLPGVRKIRFK